MPGGMSVEPYEAGRRLKRLEECRPGELFERRGGGEKDVFERRGWGALNPPRPLRGQASRPARQARSPGPVTRTTVAIVLAAAVCAGLAAALVWGAAEPGPCPPVRVRHRRRGA